MPFTNAKLCRECGGLCCKSTPGTTHPEEWGTSPAAMEAALAAAFHSDQWVIDWWEGDPREPLPENERPLSTCNFVRPAQQGVGKSISRLDPVSGRDQGCRTTGK
jgi:hypothetical protein